MIGIPALLLTAGLSAPGQVYSFEGDTLPQDRGWSIVGANPVAETRSDGGTFFAEAIEPESGGIDYRQVFIPASEAVSYQWRATTVGPGGGSFLQLQVRGENDWSEVWISWWEDFASIHTSLNSSGEYLEIPLTGTGFHDFEFLVHGDSVSVFVDDTRALQMDAFPSPKMVQNTLQFGFTRVFSDRPISSQWDYIHVEELPEPTSFALLATLLLTMQLQRGNGERGNGVARERGRAGTGSGVDSVGRPGTGTRLVVAYHRIVVVMACYHARRTPWPPDMPCPASTLLPEHAPYFIPKGTPRALFDIHITCRPCDRATSACGAHMKITERTHL